MTAARPADILRLLEPPAAPDGELLALFARTRDAAAFAELVRRHGPLVLGVCRRVTGNAHDAEDAFQATFLVLAQKAGALSNAALLGNWLYGVAFRVARRAKRSAARRRAREVTVPTLPDPPAPEERAALPELGPVLDEELAALAEHYRDAIVLCDLRGLSREAAAEALGVPEGTLSSRLANGRKKLAVRLARRGIALPAAGLAAVLGDATASVPAVLLARTCQTVTDWAATGTAPAALAALAKGGFAMRMSLLFGGALALGLAGAVFAARPDADPPVPPKPPAVVNVPDDKKLAEPKAPERGVAYASPRLRRASEEQISQLTNVLWDPKGTHLAVQGIAVVLERKMNSILLVPVEENDKKVSGSCGASEELVAVAPDGTSALTILRENHLISGMHRLREFAQKDRPAFNPKGGAAPIQGRALVVERSVELEPSRAWQYAFAPDLKSFRMLAPVDSPGAAEPKWEVVQVSAETGQTGKKLVDIPEGTVSLSPDGRRAAHISASGDVISAYDVGGAKKLWEYKLPSGTGRLPKQGPVFIPFSPNGKFVFVSLGIGSAVLLDGETGRPARELEGLGYRETKAGEAPVVIAEARPGYDAFTADGRLFAALVSRYKVTVTPGRSFGGGGKAPDQREFAPAGTALVVWDTETGKVLKSWPASGSVRVAFNPVRPVLAVAEPNGESNVRLGFWDFAAEVKK